MAATTLKEAVIQALNKAASSFYTAQTLTPEQKQVARENIGAMSSETSPSVPTGTILPFAGTVIPAGYLPCNGANVSRTDYANLFAAIGTKWGEGDGSTTFTLPNFNDRFIEGTTDTEKVGQYLEAGAPNITGTSSYRNNIGVDSSSKMTGAFSLRDRFSNYRVLGEASSGYYTEFSANSSNSAYGIDTVQPKSSYTLIIIKQ